MGDLSLSTIANIAAIRLKSLNKKMLLHTSNTVVRRLTRVAES